MKDVGKSKKLPSYRKPSPEVSERMKRVKSHGTGLEKAMEKILIKRKINYEMQPNIYGRPDFRISNTNILIFCDSSFWHGRRKKEITGEAFNRNKEFWTAKLNGNRKRDARTTRKLRNKGWSVLRFWDDDILKSPEKNVRRLNRKVEEKCQTN